MGSKARVAKELLQIFKSSGNCLDHYIEPFAGGMNMLSIVPSPVRIANDSNYYLIEMWKKLCAGWIPEKISRERYEDIRKNQSTTDPWLVGWVGFNCSYSGKWFGGFAGETRTKLGTIRDYQSEAIRNSLKQITSLNGVQFVNKNYLELEIPKNSFVYCDPPYQGTTNYKDKFCHKIFWSWVKAIRASGSFICVSEYSAPEDFTPIWCKELKSSLSANGKVGGSKISQERLFIPN